jgi:hypothetical protein
MTREFLLSGNEIAEMNKIREAVRYLFGDDSIKHEEYIFSGGGGIGPHCIHFRLVTTKDVEIRKDVTDYSSW